MGIPSPSELPRRCTVSSHNLQIHTKHVDCALCFANRPSAAKVDNYHLAKESNRGKSLCWLTWFRDLHAGLRTSPAMENPGVGEMARASSSTPIAAPSERKQFDPVRDAVAYTELEDATAGTHYPTAPKAYEAAGSTAVNHAAASQAPWDQGRVATQETHAMTSSYAHDPAAIPADSSNADGFPEHYDMSVDARHEQHPAATHGYGAQLPGDEDHDGPSMDTDQMSQATSAPSMELYVRPISPIRRCDKCSRDAG